MYLRNHKILNTYKCYHCTHVYDNLTSLKKHLTKISIQEQRLLVNNIPVIEISRDDINKTDPNSINLG